MINNAQSLLKRLLPHLGPLLLVGLLIGLLSGGFPPANWRSLLLLLIHPSAYRAAPGASLQEAQLILWIQSALLLIVWIGWLVLGIRELSAFLRGPAKVSPASSRTLPPITPPLRPGSTSSASKGPTNPFENLARRRYQSGTITLARTAEAKKEQQRQALASQAQEKRLLPAAKPEAPAGPPLPPASSREKESTAQPARNEPSDPFDVRPDLLDLFTTPDLPVSPSPLRKEAEHKQDEEPSEFVFGNPFEGPLPEVFEYDADLKQSLSDLLPSSESGKQNSTGKKKLSTEPLRDQPDTP